MSDRKYSQRGYRDEERGESHRPSAPRPPTEGPRGRGLGAPTKVVFRCARCGAEQIVAGEVEVAAECAGCGSALHSCTNCQHFDSSAPNECRQEIPLRIAGKAAANECELFAAKRAQESAGDMGGPDDPRAAFDALFKI